MAETEVNTGQDNTSTETNEQKPSETLLSGSEQADTEASASEDKQDEKPEGEQDEKKEEKTEKPEGAPDEYKDFELPEGVQVDKEIVDQYKQMAKEMDLPQEKAQKLINLAAKNIEKAQEAQRDLWDNTRKEWVESIKSDKEFGGNQFNETIVRAKRALNEYGTPEFKSFLDQTGYGDNPELIKMLAKIDKARGESKTIDGEPSNESGKSLASRIYGG